MSADGEPSFHPFDGSEEEKGSVEISNPSPDCVFGKPCKPLGEQCSAFKCAAAHDFTDDLGL